MLDTEPSSGTYWLVDSNPEAAKVKTIPAAASATTVKSERVCNVLQLQLY